MPGAGDLDRPVTLGRPPGTGDGPLPASPSLPAPLPAAIRQSDGAEDAALLVALGAGDRGEPLRLLYERYAPRVFGLGVRALGDRGLAEELVQETFLRLWRAAGRYDPARGTAAAFIFVVARRLAIDLWRRPSSRPLGEELPDRSDPPAGEGRADRSPSDPAAGGADIEHLLLRLAVQDAMAAVPPAQREVLELSIGARMKQTEIAERLAIPLGTVKTRTYYGLRSLRAALEERGIHG